MTLSRHSLSRVWLTAALVFWLLNAGMHLAFSNFIGTRFSTPFGDIVPVDYTLPAATLVLLVFVGCFMVGLKQGHNRLVTCCGWVAVSGAMALCIFTITPTIATTQVEMIHFLQYGLLAFMLARGIDGDHRRWPLVSLMLLTTLLGILDELNQYFYLTRPNSTYIDFNDFVLNQVGACAGLLAWYGFRAAPVKSNHWGALQLVTASGYALLGFVVLVLGLAGRLRYNPEQTVPPGGIDFIDGNWVIFFQREPGLLGSSQPTFSAGEYFVMGAMEGILVMLLITGLLYLFSRLYQTPSRKA